jgi:hypothetical protein
MSLLDRQDCHRGLSGQLASLPSVGLRAASRLAPYRVISPASRPRSSGSLPKRPSNPDRPRSRRNTLVRAGDNAGGGPNLAKGVLKGALRVIESGLYQHGRARGVRTLVRTSAGWTRRFAGVFESYLPHSPLFRDPAPGAGFCSFAGEWAFTLLVPSVTESPENRTDRIPRLIPREGRNSGRGRPPRCRRAWPLHAQPRGVRLGCARCPRLACAR